MGEIYAGYAGVSRVAQLLVVGGNGIRDAFDAFGRAIQCEAPANGDYCLAVVEQVV